MTAVQERDAIAETKRAWRRCRHRRVVCGLLIVMLTAVACASTPSAPATAIPIQDFRMVAGKWVGVVLGLAGPRDDAGDWIELTISADGTFEFGISRTIGVLRGKGKFTLADGKMTSESDRGSAAYALSELGGRQYLHVVATLRSGRLLSGNLNRAP